MVISSYTRLSKNFEDAIKLILKPPLLTQVPCILLGNAVLITVYPELLGATASPQAVGYRATIKKDLVAEFTSTGSLSMLFCLFACLTFETFPFCFLGCL